MLTLEQAIEILKGYKQRLDNSCSNQLDNDKEAFESAIKALEERPQGEILVEHCIEFNSNPSCCRNCHSKCTWFKCSKCSCVVDTEDKFCKHCGAELKGKEE